MRWTRILVPLGGTLVVLGALVPSAWLAGGVPLVRALLIAEGLALVAVGAFGIRFLPLPRDVLLDPTRPATPGSSNSRVRLFVGLGAVTLLALGLRLVHLGDDLWLDEIVTVRLFAEGSVHHIFSAYNEPNNHLLNSLAVHLSLRVFGHYESAIRLPALIWGVATVPVLFWTARQLLGPLQSLAAATLLAVSYQHVFFSQNARGYTAYMLFGLLATALLRRGLAEDRLGLWIAYVVASLLCVAAVPTGAFVVVGNGLVAVAALVIAARRRAAGVRMLLRRLAVVHGIVLALAAQLYAPVITRAAGAAQSAWNNTAAGFKPISLGFARQLGQGFTSGVGPILLLLSIPVGVAGLLGAWSVVRRDWALMAGLMLGPLLHAAIVVARGYAFAPRFLIFLAFAAILAGVETVRLAAVWASRAALWFGRPLGHRSRRAVQLASLVLVAAVLAAPLARYFRIQKQPYRLALARVKSLRPHGSVIAIDNMEQGVRYYAVEHPHGRALVEGHNLFFVRSSSALDAALARSAGRTPILMTTLERGLHTSQPRLDARIRDGWSQAEMLKGSIGDGGITIWLPRRR